MLVVGCLCLQCASHISADDAEADQFAQAIASEARADLERYFSSPSYDKFHSKIGGAIMRKLLTSYTTAIARSNPLEWKFNREILVPVGKRAFIPEYLHRYEALPVAAEFVVAQVNYGRSQQTTGKGVGILPNTVGDGTSPATTSRVWFATTRAPSSDISSATLLIKRLVKERSTDRVYALLVFESYRLSPSDDEGAASWVLIGKSHCCYPSMED